MVPDGEGRMSKSSTLGIHRVPYDFRGHIEANSEHGE